MPNISFCEGLYLLKPDIVYEWMFTHVRHFDKITSWLCAFRYSVTCNWDKGLLPAIWGSRAIKHQALQIMSPLLDCLDQPLLRILIASIFLAVEYNRLQVPKSKSAPSLGHQGQGMPLLQSQAITYLAGHILWDAWQDVMNAFLPALESKLAFSDDFGPGYSMRMRTKVSRRMQCSNDVMHVHWMIQCIKWQGSEWSQLWTAYSLL